MTCDFFPDTTCWVEVGWHRQQCREEEHRHSREPGVGLTPGSPTCCKSPGSWSLPSHLSNGSNFYCISCLLLCNKLPLTVATLRINIYYLTESLKVGNLGHSGSRCHWDATNVLVGAIAIRWLGEVAPAAPRWVHSGSR